MAGNIGGEFNLAVWRISGQSAKLRSAKHSAHGDFDDLVLYARQIKIRQSSKKWENYESAKYYSCQYFRPYGNQLRTSDDRGQGSHVRGLYQLAMVHMLYTTVRGQSQVVSRELLQPLLRDRVWLRYTW